MNRYANEATRIALMPEEYDPKVHYYLFATDEKGYSIKDDFYKRQIKNLSNEDIKELRSITPGVFEDYEVISKVREIHSFIINNKKLFEENEKNRYMNMYTEMDFKYRNLYFAYRLKDGSLIEREYPLLTYMDNPELDNLIREYLAIPGVMQSYEPILTKMPGIPEVFILSSRPTMVNITIFRLMIIFRNSWTTIKGHTFIRSLECFIWRE